VLTGKGAEIKFKALLVVEALIEKTVHALGNSALQLLIKLEIDLLEVARFETVKDDLVPDK
jgi:hypothetical protein